MKKIETLLVLSILFLTACSFLATSNEEGIMENNDGFALVQLFTSQGCSSCPSADRLLEEVKDEYKDENVFVLSYHVDYWNRLGWKDPFSTEEFTKKQHQYGRKFGEGRVYTPQAVINGSLHFVGSSEVKMKTNLSRFLNGKTENSVTLSNIKSESNSVSLNYSVDGKTTGKNLKLALVIDKRRTSVKRGENGGRTIENSNIVVEEISLPLTKFEGDAKIDIPELVKESDKLSVIAFVQDSDLKITGAASADLK